MESSGEGWMEGRMIPAGLSRNFLLPLFSIVVTLFSIVATE